MLVHQLACFKLSNLLALSVDSCLRRLYEQYEIQSSCHLGRDSVTTATVVNDKRRWLLCICRLLHVDWKHLCRS